MSLSAGVIGTVSGGPRWTPLQLGTSLAGWYDAADASTITLTSSAVSQWNDKSSNARHMTQTTSTRRPTVLAAEQNGLDVITCDLRKYVATSFGTAITGSAISVFAVAKPTTSWVQYARLLTTAASTGLDYSTTSAIIPLLRNATNSQMYVFFNAGGVAAASVTVGSWSVIGSVVDGTATTVHVNGGSASGTISSTPSFNITRMVIGTSIEGANGGTFTDTDWWSSPVAEVIVYAGAFTTTQRQQSEGYLAHKWGLTGSLPSDHPYKSIRP